MYSFKNLKPATGADNNLSSCSFFIDEQYIEHLIEGYQTINVYGRESTDMKLSMIDNVPGRDGGIFLESSLPPRPLIVEYIIKSKDPPEMAKNYDRLKEIIAGNKNKARRLIFRDEAAFFYNAFFYGMDDVASEGLSVIGRFSFICLDPYKHAIEARTDSGNPLTIGDLSEYGATPEIIKVTPSENTQKTVITNQSTGRKIVLNTDINAGQVLEIRIAENMLTVNGQNRMQDLDYTVSDFHQFTVKQGQKISINYSGNFQITTRNRML